MTELTYMCENCLEPHIFSPLDENSEYKCPECGENAVLGNSRNRSRN